MTNFSELIQLIQLTRAQAQYGYLLHGIPRNQISNLAEHHYLVTFIGWQLASELKNAQVKIDVQKVMEYCLIHDLGELMGGDISGPYANQNPKARKFAKQFEEENQKFLSKFFGKDQKKIRMLGKEILDAKTIESLVAKVADYLECTAYLVYVGHMNSKTAEFNNQKILSYIKKIKDKPAQEILIRLVADWFSKLNKKPYIELFNKK